MGRWLFKREDVAERIEEGIIDCLAVFHMPPAHRVRLRTTNACERFNQELKRRTRVARIFPNRASLLRLVSALAMEQAEEWETGRRYLDMGQLEEWDRQRAKDEGKMDLLDAWRRRQAPTTASA